MAKNWCKIISLKDHDVLVQRLSNDEDGEHIEFKMIIDGVTASFKASYDEDKAVADETFESFSEKDAQKLLDNTLKMFS